MNVHFDVDKAIEKARRDLKASASLSLSKCRTNKDRAFVEMQRDLRTSYFEVDRTTFELLNAGHPKALVMRALAILLASEVKVGVLNDGPDFMTMFLRELKDVFEDNPDRVTTSVTEVTSVQGGHA